MKNLSILLLATLMFTFMNVMTSCTDDDGEDIVADPLNITVEETGTPTYTPGTTVNYSITITSGEKMKTLTVEINGAIDEAFTKDLNNQTGTVTIPGGYDYMIPTSANPGDQISIVFKAEDKKTTDSDTKIITVVAEETPIAGEHSGVIYHILGPYQGAWDLVNDEGVSEGGSANRYTGSNKDMINIENVDPGDFIHGWVAGNTTRFVKVTGFDYANATVEGAKAAYESGSPIGDHSYSAGDTGTGNPVMVSEGDIIVAKIRGNDEYAVIKIEAINDTGVEDNKDDITFSYKKASMTKVGGKTLMVFR